MKIFHTRPPKSTSAFGLVLLAILIFLLLLIPFYLEKIKFLSNDQVCPQNKIFLNFAWQCFPSKLIKDNKCLEKCLQFSFHNVVTLICEPCAYWSHEIQNCLNYTYYPKAWGKEAFEDLIALLERNIDTNRKFLSDYPSEVLFEEESNVDGYQHYCFPKNPINIIKPPTKALGLVKRILTEDHFRNPPLEIPFTKDRRSNVSNSKDYKRRGKKYDKEEEEWDLSDENERKELEIRKKTEKKDEFPKDRKTVIIKGPTGDIIIIVEELNDQPFNTEKAEKEVNEDKNLEIIESFNEGNLCFGENEIQNGEKSMEKNLEIGELVILVEENDKTRIEGDLNTELDSLSEQQEMLITNQARDINSEVSVTEADNFEIQNFTQEKSINEAVSIINCSDLNFYQYPNNTCSSYCPLGSFVIKNSSINDHKLCIPCSLPCSTCEIDPDHCKSCASDSPYLYQNWTCLPTCPEDIYIIMESQGQRSCLPKKYNQTAEIIVTHEEKKVIEAVVNYNIVTGILTSISLVSIQMLNHGYSSTTSLVILINLIEYIKYIDINYPSRLLDIFRNKLDNFVSFDIIPDFPDRNSQDIRKYVSPKRFLRYQINGLFIVNYWQNIITLLALAAIAFLAWFLSRRKFKSLSASRFVQNLENFFIWNFMITFFASNLDDAIIFAIVEYQSLYLGNALPIISFCINMLFICGYIVFQIYITTKICQIKYEKRYISPEEKLKLNLKFRILFEDLKNDCLLQALMIPLLCLKVTAATIIIAGFDNPVVQSIFLLLLNFALLLYLIKYKPLKKHWKNFELIFYELLQVIANATCFRLSFQDRVSQSENYTAEIVIIVVNLILISLVFLLQIMELGIKLKEFIKSVLKMRKSDKIQPSGISNDFQTQQFERKNEDLDTNVEQNGVHNIMNLSIRRSKNLTISEKQGDTAEIEINQ